MASVAEKDAGERHDRTPSLVDALIPCFTLIALLALSYTLYGEESSTGPNQIALLFCGIIAAAIAYKNGMEWNGLRGAVVDGVAAGLPAIMILLAVGALIGAWALSGTIMTMVYYGLQILSPSFFYATVAIVCAVIAFSIGSSWTVAGTVGIGLMGVAASMGLSPGITAGAIISGAYFGDKASPLSDTVNLAAATTGADVYDHIRESLWTSVPALALAAALFMLLGEPKAFDPTPVLEEIQNRTTITAWALLPLLLVLALSIARFPAFVTIFLGALAGVVLAVMNNPAGVAAFAASPALPYPLQLLKGAWSALATGHVGQSGHAAIDTILTRGGMASMMTTVWLILSALSFGAIMERAGLLNRLIDPLIARLKSVAALVTALVGSCIGANVVTSDQYIAIALPGRLFGPAFAKRGLAPVMLSRVVGDSATVTSPLIPWNSCGAYMAAALGVPTIAYAGFCFFNMLNPLVTIGFTLIGLRVITRPRADADDARHRREPA